MNEYIILFLLFSAVLVFMLPQPYRNHVHTFLAGVMFVYFLLDYLDRRLAQLQPPVNGVVTGVGRGNVVSIDTDEYGLLYGRYEGLRLLRVGEVVKVKVMLGRISRLPVGDFIITKRP